VVGAFRRVDDQQQDALPTIPRRRRQPMTGAATGAEPHGPDEPPYYPQLGYHEWEAGPDRSDNDGDPHAPGWCTGKVGEVVGRNFVFRALAIHGTLSVTLDLTDGLEDTALPTQAECVQMANQLLIMAERAADQEKPRSGGEG
jgi:hypothetical protein